MGCSSNKEKKRKTLLKIGRSNITNEIKVVFLGDAGVGKSSIAQRFCYNKFSDSYDVTLGGVYFKKELKVQNGQTLSLHLWDTGGEERFRYK
jgi:small GTP-binding protein